MSRTGEGTAWLIADRARGDYLCYWYTGIHDGRLLDRARMPTAAEAVAWGLARTPGVRIRSADGRTSWAGTAPRPVEFTNTWDDPSGAA